jgi:hypothetical protein
VRRSRSRAWATAAILATVAPAAVALGAAGAEASSAAVLAPAATSGPCPTADHGVTVVVDLAAFGGGVVTRCAPGAPSSGFAALRDAGFTITPVSSNHGFLCRIDGLPGPEADPCQEIPPASAYWSYHLADRGGTWQASTRGAGNRTPPPGSVEGWAFGSGSPPSVPPPPPPAPPTTAPPTTAPPHPTGASGGGADAPPAGNDPALPTSGARPGDTDPGGSTPGDDRSVDPADEAGAAEDAPTVDGAEADTTEADPTEAGPAETGTGEATGRGAEDRASGALVVADRDGPDRGAPAATAAGIGLVAVLGGAALWQARRRTRPDLGEGLS